MIQFLVHKVIIRNRNVSNIILLTSAILSVGPAFTVFMLLMDLVFTFNSTIIDPLAFLFDCCRCQCLNEVTNNIYKLLFQMKKYEVGGFRRMRTSSQMMFETKI